ncbi:transglycosylase family protein [Nocardiopsis suaedae]|uniref:Transglycosylase family protein n=1 Tax=Nocardiopsis suaedae TaxID=3018444 RepID=A0ABT4TEM9_9ACTN|nr:transglycosylase family protein [Nocardiopsis suaedae]MDA2803158.1 transglycosylase family protein [Nocardiopsis suaedae]
MLFNRISPRLAAGIGAAGLTAGALFAGTVYFAGADTGEVTGAAVQPPPQAGGEDFFAGVEGVSDEQRASAREEARNRIDEADSAAGASGVAAPEKKEEEPEEDSAEDGSSDSGGGPVGDTSADADSLNWPALAQCESGGDPTAVNEAGGYYGLYQFSMSTWQSVGGSGSPAEAPSSEQTTRAKMLYDAVGGNWQSQWPECGRHLFD